jgi:hypothetical protein
MTTAITTTKKKSNKFMSFMKKAVEKVELAEGKFDLACTKAEVKMFGEPVDAIWYRADARVEEEIRWTKEKIKSKLSK